MGIEQFRAIQRRPPIDPSRPLPPVDLPRPRPLTEPTNPFRDSRQPKLSETRPGRTGDILTGAQLLLIMPAVFAATMLAVGDRKLSERLTPGRDGFVSLPAVLEKMMEEEVNYGSTHPEASTTGDFTEAVAERLDSGNK